MLRDRWSAHESSFCAPQELLEWADRYGAAVLEDDYDSEFRFGDRPIEPLQTIDRTGRVIYVGSFSKTMLPSLRLGFVIAPPGLTAAIASAKYVSDWHSSTHAQLALADFIDSGAFARHVRKMRLVYAKRRHLILDTLRKDFPDYLEIVPSTVGLHVAALTKPRVRVSEVVRRAYRAGVAVQDLAWFSTDVNDPSGIILGYGAISQSRIKEGLARLRECFND